MERLAGCKVQFPASLWSNTWPWEYDNKEWGLLVALLTTAETWKPLYSKWTGLGHSWTSSRGSLSVLVMIELVLWPWIALPDPSGWEASLSAFCVRPCTFLFPQVFPSSVLKSDLLYLVSQGLGMTIQAPTDAEDPFFLRWCAIISYSWLKVCRSACWLVLPLGFPFLGTKYLSLYFASTAKDLNLYCSP